jgi:hypothetical protein
LVAVPVFLSLKEVEKQRKSKGMEASSSVDVIPIKIATITTLVPMISVRTEPALIRLAVTWMRMEMAT